MNAVLVFLGGGLGAVLRYGVNRLASAGGASFPIGTLIVNVVGSLIIGLLAGLFAAHPAIKPPVRLFLATGLLGGFTTFSAFSLDALSLYQRGQIGPALGYVAASVILSLAAIAIGYSLARL